MQYIIPKNMNHLKQFRKDLNKWMGDGSTKGYLKEAKNGKNMSLRYVSPESWTKVKVPGMQKVLNEPFHVPLWLKDK